MIATAPSRFWECERSRSGQVGETGTCVFSASEKNGVSLGFQFVVAGKPDETDEGAVPTDFVNLGDAGLPAQCLIAAGMTPGRQVECGKKGAHQFYFGGFGAFAFDCSD